MIVSLVVTVSVLGKMQFIVDWLNDSGDKSHSHSLDTAAQKH